MLASSSFRLLAGVGTVYAGTAVYLYTNRKKAHKDAVVFKKKHPELYNNYQAPLRYDKNDSITPLLAVASLPFMIVGGIVCFPIVVPLIFMMRSRPDYTHVKKPKEVKVTGKPLSEKERQKLFDNMKKTMEIVNSYNIDKKK